MLPELRGNWDRPCLDCGKTPADGAEFNHAGRGFRKSYCVLCSRARSAAHDKANPKQAKAREARRVRDWTGDFRNRVERSGMDPVTYARRRNIKTSFGITLEEYRERFAQQGGHCSICDRVLSLDGDYNEDKAVLDHDHATGELRSFLCVRCNVMLGMAQDSPNRLRAAADYLSETTTNQGVS